MGDIMKSESLLKKYQKAMKSKDNLSDQEKSKIHYNYVSKLFFRIFLSSLLLLMLIMVDRVTYKKNKTTIIDTNIRRNWNFLKMTNVFNTLFGEFFKIDNSIDVYHANVYDNVKYENNVNYITNNSFSGVTNLTSGIITKIKKEKDGTYTITIQGSDDFVYTYGKLSSVDYHIYTYVDASDIIGLANYDNSKYHFTLTIEKEGVYYDFYENAQD